jgi:RimJ/RimL family protein N-acetyltransferase
MISTLTFERFATGRGSNSRNMKVEPEFRSLYFRAFPEEEGYVWQKFEEQPGEIIAWYIGYIGDTPHTIGMYRVLRYRYANPSSGDDVHTGYMTSFCVDPVYQGQGHVRGMIKDIVPAIMKDVDLSVIFFQSYPDFIRVYEENIDPDYEVIKLGPKHEEFLRNCDRLPLLEDPNEIYYCIRSKDITIS